MEQKLLLELNNHYVYYIKTEYINYYVNVPKTNMATSISLELKSKMENYNLETNDEIWVMENIKNTYNFIDQYNITLVLPILNDECISILEKMDKQKFEAIDKILGYIINHAYMDLRTKNVDVDSTVIMINNDRYKTFLTWFVNKYSDRVELKKMLEVIQKFNATATPYKKFETPAISFVVGTYNDEVNAPKIERVVEEPQPEITNKKVKSKSKGFSSYWLLAAITMVVSISVILAMFVFKD